MNLQGLGKVETADAYLDIVFRRAKKIADEKRLNVKLSKKVTRLDKSRIIEIERLRSISSTIQKHLDKIVQSFPVYNQLDEFYQALMNTTIDVPQYKKSLGAMGWAVKKANQFAKDYASKITRSKDITAINNYRRQFYGRASSVMKQIKHDLLYLDECRKIMKNYPTIKTAIPTVAIAGYPNVGKTTLLKLLTGAKPKIASYPFTTQRLMLGYYKDDEQKIQFIDTPGLLDRPLKKRNAIETQAILALKYLTKIILFIVDPSEHCGYSIEKQIALFKDIKEKFKLPFIVTLNKIDAASKEQISEVKKKIRNTIEISAEKKQGTKELLEMIIDKLRDE